MVNNIKLLENGDFEVAPLRPEDIIIWSVDNCSYCMMAKQLLEKSGYKYEDRNVDSDIWSMDQLLDIEPDIRTMPQIFMDGKHIGGFDDLDAYIYLKELD